MALHAETKKEFLFPQNNVELLTRMLIKLQVATTFHIYQTAAKCFEKGLVKNVAPFTYLRPKMLSVRVNKVDKIRLAQVRSSSQSPVNQQNFVRKNRFFIVLMF